jgi:hypothetical protein
LLALRGPLPRAVVAIAIKLPVKMAIAAASDAKKVLARFLWTLDCRFEKRFQARGPELSELEKPLSRRL